MKEDVAMLITLQALNFQVKRDFQRMTCYNPFTIVQMTQLHFCVKIYIYADVDYERCVSYISVSCGLKKSDHFISFIQQ